MHGFERRPETRETARRRRQRRNGPAAVTPAAPRICTQLSTMWLQLSAVSSQRIGTVVVPLVWWQRT